MKLHVLATVRKRELLPAAALLFRTLRTGFPSAQVQVWGNALTEPAWSHLRGWAEGCQADLDNLPATSHDAWLEGLILQSTAPFWICDTDIVFFGPMTPPPGAILSGRLEPAFDEEWTGTRHVERLHTCVMYIDPALVREKIRAAQCVIGEPFRWSAQWPMIHQTFVPVRGEQTRFYDTTAGLWQAGIGTPLAEAVDRNFEHLHCGTYVDVIEREAPGLSGLRARHEAIYANPEAARGLREIQAQYYASRNTIDNESQRLRGQSSLSVHDTER